MRVGILVCLAWGVAGCAETPPADVLNYDACILMTPTPLEPTGDDDPHLGFKSVYGCNVTVEQLQNAPVSGYPEGALIIKTATRDEQDFPWLLATMRKEGGEWTWNEYTRNFADEAFAHIPAGPDVCTDCHSQVAGVDWVFTVYQAQPEGGTE